MSIAEMNPEQMKAEYERVLAENAALKAKSTSTLSLKVSEKGAVSVYGLGRFPVTLYREQMLRLLDAGDRIRAFVAANSTILKNKGE